MVRCARFAARGLLLAAVLVPAARGAGDDLELESDAFADGAPIPVEYTCDGDDMSPPLRWSGAPPKTKSFALIVEDPDAPGADFVHWVVYNVPDAARALDAKVDTRAELGDGTLQGKNDFGNVFWGGPCPPPGSAHRYVFRLFALDEVVALEPGATAGELRKAIEGNVLARGELTGKYRRAEKEK